MTGGNGITPSSATMAANVLYEFFTLCNERGERIREESVSKIRYLGELDRNALNERQEVNNRFRHWSNPILTTRNRAISPRQLQISTTL